jgi:hypothetical protein
MGDKMKSFGIGCFHFGISDESNKEIFSVKEYISEVKNVLEKISSISDINISYDEDLKNHEFTIELPNPRLQNGDFCHPYIESYNLEFKIYIPFRIQAKLIGIKKNYLDTNTENFKVYFRHNWHGPLSFVECLNPTLETKPSSAVRIIREYISTEIKKIDTFLIYDFIGPSPFHANLYLTIDENKDKEETNNYFKIEHFKTHGYDELYIKYRKSDFKFEEEALEYLLNELESEVAYFYDFKIKEIHKSNEWSIIYKGMHSILDFEDKESKKTFKDKYFNRPKLFKEVFKDIGLFKGQEIFNKNINNKDYSSIYKHSHNQTYLQYFIDKEISESMNYPLDETIELLKYFDQKSSKTFELMVIFIATIMGGVIGSSITILFSK